MGTKKTEKTNLSKLGEFGLIKHLTEEIKINQSTTIKGIGDDAAVLNYKKNLVVTTDLLLEGIHFDLMYTPLKHLGYKSVIVNLSDVYAMNAIPRQITVSIGISSKYTLEMIDELYEGIKLACEIYNVDLVGGDTSSSLTGLTISITAIGEVETQEVYRNTAKKNDIICVTGDLGASFLGLQLLEREKDIFESHPEVQPELGDYGYLLERQLKPEARKDIIDFFKEVNVIPTSMIDISDGLSSDLIHICTQSEKGCRIYESKLPVHEQSRKMANEFNLDATTAVMNGGEDYELLFTISPDKFELVQNNPAISEIGFITDKKEDMYLEAKDGSLVGITAQGWNSLLED